MSINIMFRNQLSGILTTTMILLIFLVFNSQAGITQSFKIDLKKSKINWIGEKITGKHLGGINIKSGDLALDGAKLTGIIEIDMNSMTNYDIADEEYKAKLIKHLKNDDFFSVDKFPVSTFKMTKASPYKAKSGETANYFVTGMLTIKGITNEISFQAQIDIKDNYLRATANIVIDRTKWNIRYGSGSFFDNLGDKAIYDDIKFEVYLEGVAS
ncbi:MAG: lipid-binding protein [Ignavibacteria bacterium]|nr:lipid-binding protein [Ignavibacteria bacterium]